MRSATLLLALALAACEAKQPNAEKSAPADAEAKPPGPEAAKVVPNDVVLDHEVELLSGDAKSLSDYRGKALLVVNTASECGFTPQYADLQAVYAKYKDRGLEVLAFPSNDFGAQEPGTPEQIDAFVHSEYAVEFELFDKVVTTGADKDPVYRTLTEETGEGIKGEVTWNFTKFLVDPQGRVVRRFEPPVKPTDPEVIAAIEQVLPGA
ncbi:Hydroperoxy fatty acid reductase gpx1 [Enhygromyxa salina]|uniref:Glutathione peroxidase n=1 Tax=Enhygromyxa salina TaxID=215803 RepID=A0A2S9YE79_9BACT|nr:glutathione peroxidase [Enhygromyxa salina]PRQ03424.1 Hydroperoxy fatty acid reductase gpx1 [Enhygromyxa salina]